MIFTPDNDLAKQVNQFEKGFREVMFSVVNLSGLFLVKIAATVFRQKVEFKEKNQGILQIRRSGNRAAGLNFEIQAQQRPIKVARLHSFTINKIKVRYILLKFS